MNAYGASGVQALDRLYLIIELLSAHPKGISLAEICAATQLPKSTVSRMLASLITHDYAVQDMDSKKYRLTMRLFEIGCRVVESMGILPVARPYLEYLSILSKEVVHLVARADDEVIYLYKEDPSNSIVRTSSYVGLRNPMYCTGVGKSILAFLPDEEFRSIWSRITPTRYTSTTITDFSAMQSEIARIRQCGYAIDDEEHEEGIRCIAAPILDFNAYPIAAISLSAPASRMDDKKIQEYAPAVLDAVANISRYYGRSYKK